MTTELLDRPQTSAAAIHGDPSPSIGWSTSTQRVETHVPGSIPAAWLAALLEDVDIGLLLVDGQGQVLFTNRSAEQALAADGSGLWQHTAHARAAGRPAWQLRAHRAGVLDAVRATIARRSRKLLTLRGGSGDGSGSGTVAVLPFDPAPHAALLVLGRQQVCEPLTIQCFAMAHQLTCSESRVLVHLCEGLPPVEIAQRQGVLLSTVRTQLGAIRTKTGARSSGALVRRIASLPPMLSPLGRRGGMCS